MIKIVEKWILGLPWGDFQAPKLDFGVFENILISQPPSARPKISENQFSKRSGIEFLLRLKCDGSATGVRGECDGSATVVQPDLSGRFGVPG